MKPIILVAGATGVLGEKIIIELLKKDIQVRILVRKESAVDKIAHLEKLGTKVYLVNFENIEEISNACLGVTCIVSALAGLKDVIIDTQKKILDAAIAAGVPRFIPSDYSLDFTKFNPGENRNLDWRREFHHYLDNAPIKATSIFNGAFADMLTGQMPLILFKQKLILFWGHANHPMSFTTIDNTAAYTANVALDNMSPRYLRIAGDTKSPSEMKKIMTELSGKKFRLIRAGGLNLLSLFIKLARKIAPREQELYPAWQGMQYMRNMIDDRALNKTLDNDRYPSIQWTTAKNLLTANLNSTSI